MKKLFLNIFSLLNTNTKKKIFYLLFFSIIISILEIINISLVGYFVKIITQFSDLLNSQVIRNFYLFKLDITLNKNNIINFILLTWVVFVFVTLGNYFINLIIISLTNKVSFNISDNLFKKFLVNEKINHSKYNFAIIQNLVFSESIRAGSILMSILLILSKIIYSLFIIIFLIYFNFKLTLIMVFSLTFIYFLYLMFIKKKFLKKSLLFTKFNKLRFEIFNRTLKGLKEIRVYKLQKYFFKKFSFTSLYLEKIRIFFKAFDILPKTILDILIFSGIVVFSITIIFVLENDINKHLSSAAIFLFATYRLLPNIQQIYSNYNTLNSERSSILEINNFNKYDHNFFNINQKNINFEQLKLKNISIQYNNKTVIKNFNYNFLNNEKYILHGPSGVGKSSLLDVICGFKEIKSGDIYLNKKKIFTKVDLIKLRNIISYVPQKPFIFNATVLENIVLDQKLNNKNKKRLKNILKLCDIKFRNLSFEKLLKLKIGEDFQNISGGEKQKIAIARALFRKPKILILDESTNSIDRKSENKIVNNLTSYKEILLLFVSHNVSLIKKFKNVIKLNKIRN